MITLLTEIKNNGMLSTYQGNVIMKCDKKITVSEGTDYKYLFTFKHPATGVCTEPGSRCGFIVRRRRTGAYWERVLCTKSEDYKNTGVHYHDNISAHEMFWYDIESGRTADGNTVTVVGFLKWAVQWFPHVRNWVVKEANVAYNVTDYLVAKQN